MSAPGMDDRTSGRPDDRTSGRPDDVMDDEAPRTVLAPAPRRRGIAS